MTLFDRMMEYAHIHRPRAIIIENVDEQFARACIETAISTLPGYRRETFTADGAAFAHHISPEASAVLPTGGPTSGDTLVVVTGPGFLAGSDYRCKFGVREVRAQLGGDGTNLT